MFKKILNKFENPDHPLLGPNIKILKFWGLLLPDGAKKYLYLFLHLNVILFMSTQFVEIWYIKHDMNLTLTNLKVSLLSTVTVAKVVTFLIWQKDWKNIINYVNETDKIQRNDAGKDEEHDKKDIIDKYTKYSRSITYCYGFLMLTTIIFVVSQPIIRYAVSKTYRDNIKNGSEYYALPVSTWVPFDKNAIVGYIVTCLHMDYAAFYGGAWITSFDTTAIVIMVFFRGELEMLKIDSGKICKSDTNYEFRRRLKDCHIRHIKLIKLADLCDFVCMMLHSYGSQCEVIFKARVNRYLLGRWFQLTPCDCLTSSKARSNAELCLWSNYTQRIYSALRVQYNNVLRVLCTMCWVCTMFADARIDDFYAFIRKRVASMMSYTLAVKWDNPLGRSWNGVHVDTRRYTRLFDSCLSPIMLLYMIVCSVMLCSTVYQLNVDTSVTQRIVTAEYLIFGVAQLFMYCWHSNDVFYVSKNLFRGPYESVWWTRSVPEQRNISILVNQFNKVIFFSAGPFYSITIATFIAILKGAYSYYTILSKS